MHNYIIYHTMLRYWVLIIALTVLVFGSYLNPEKGNEYTRGHSLKVIIPASHIFTSHNCADHNNHPDLPVLPICSHCARSFQTIIAVPGTSNLIGESLSVTANINDIVCIIYSSEFVNLSGPRSPPFFPFA
jgi:hypothetical protein